MFIERTLRFALWSRFAIWIILQTYRWTETVRQNFTTCEWSVVNLFITRLSSLPYLPFDRQEKHRCPLPSNHSFLLKVKNVHNKVYEPWIIIISTRLNLLTLTLWYVENWLRIFIMRNWTSNKYGCLRVSDIYCWETRYLGFELAISVPNEVAKINVKNNNFFVNKPLNLFTAQILVRLIYIA